MAVKDVKMTGKMPLGVKVSVPGFHDNHSYKTGAAVQSSNNSTRSNNRSSYGKKTYTVEPVDSKPKKTIAKILRRSATAYGKGLGVTQTATKKTRSGKVMGSTSGGATSTVGKKTSRVLKKKK